jgi:hypothetical protein
MVYGSGLRVYGLGFRVYALCLHAKAPACSRRAGNALDRVERCCQQALSLPPEGAAWLPSCARSHWLRGTSTQSWAHVVNRRKDAANAHLFVELGASGFVHQSSCCPPKAARVSLLPRKSLVLSKAVGQTNKANDQERKCTPPFRGEMRGPCTCIPSALTAFAMPSHNGGRVAKLRRPKIQ